MENLIHTFGELSDETNIFCPEQQNRTARTISVTSGKGGVGKTNVCVNLAICLAKMGKRVLLIDADFGLANIDILLNLKPKHTIESLVKDNIPIGEVITHPAEPGLANLKIICSSSGIPEMTDINSKQMKYIISRLANLQTSFDYLILDTGAGISQNILRFNAAVSEIFLISTTEPTSLRDAYAMMKVMHNNHQRNFFSLIVNQANELEAKRVYDTFVSVSKNNHLDIDINLLGYVPQDKNLTDAVRRRSAVVQHAPDGESSLNYMKIAENICGGKKAPKPSEKSDGDLWGRFFDYFKATKSA